MKLEAVDPDTGKWIEVIVSSDKLMGMSHFARSYIFETADILPKVLKQPSAIFEDFLCDADHPRRGEGWRCYCFVPGYGYDNDGVMRPAWPGKIYVAFVNSDRVVYNWHWVEADPQDSRVPKDHQKRFRTRKL
jgi:hypothetical protein